jgi:hypothetical protein
MVIESDFPRAISRIYVRHRPESVMQKRERGRENMGDRPNRDKISWFLSFADGVTHVMSVSWTMDDDPAIENKSGI